MMWIKVLCRWGLESPFITYHLIDIFTCVCCSKGWILKHFPLVLNYLAVQESRARNIESRCETRFEKEPLFPLSESQLLTQAYSEVPSSSSQQPRKKTLAATLVENTKKQSIALVPKEIAKLAQIFFPYFNPAFYPHKPPPATVSSRVLFTDSEDE